MSDTHLVVCVNERLDVNKKSCAASGSRQLIRAIQQQLAANNLEVEVVEQVCLGRCEQGVAMRVAPGGPFFTKVTGSDIDSIIDTLKNFKPSVVE